jgi:hypothetical protein
VVTIVRILALLACLIPPWLPAAARAAPNPGYTVSRMADGVEITVHFERRAYPAHALIPVTVTLHNLSHPNLAITRFFPQYPVTLCSGPPVTVLAVNAKGLSAAPPSHIEPPPTFCPMPHWERIPIGHILVEHLLVPLWSPRLLIDARLADIIRHCFCGFRFTGAFTVRLGLYPAPAPTIRLRTVAGHETAVVAAPPGARGPLYYESWGNWMSSCMTYVYYWTPINRSVVTPGCPRPRQWHLAVAWLNGPVTTIEQSVKA